jgi:hypothetical protein
MTTIVIDEQTTCEEILKCPQPCGQDVQFGYRHRPKGLAGVATPMTRHPLPACRPFIDKDAEAYERFVRSGGRS